MLGSGGWFFANCLVEHVGVSENSGYPQIIQFNSVFHYKPSILGYHYFWKHPCRTFRLNLMAAPLLWYQDAPDTKPPAVAKALSKTACKAIGIFREANDKNDTFGLRTKRHTLQNFGDSARSVFWWVCLGGAQILDLTGGFIIYAYF